MQDASLRCSACQLRLAVPLAGSSVLGFASLAIFPAYPASSAPFRSKEGPLPPSIPMHVEGGCRPLLLLLGAVGKGHGEQASYPPYLWLLSHHVRSCSCWLLHLGE